MYIQNRVPTGGHFLFTCCRHFCWQMYRSDTIYSVTDRWTDRQNDDIIIIFFYFLADHTARSWSAIGMMMSVAGVYHEYIFFIHIFTKY